MRADARAIFKAGVEAVEPARAVKRYFRKRGNRLFVSGRRYDLARFENIYVIGAGKASAAMARPVLEILGDWVKDGALNVKYGHALPLENIRVQEAGHPVPDEAGLRGTREIMSLLERSEKDDLIIFLVSGGGSALLPAPWEGISLEEIQETTRALLSCGADIREINALRKHISRLKGGRLARLASPSALISLILSDVIGNDLESIASGPTVPDTTTFSDCLDILNKYGLRGRIPPAVLSHFERGAGGDIEETPKPGDPVFARTQNVIVGSNIQALQAAAQKAETLGYRTLILSAYIAGDTREAASLHAGLAREVLASGRPLPRPACILSGGETTVVVKGKGLGGRNQEFALAAALEIAGLERVVILSGGTDGTDGPTDAAGAIVDGRTLERSREAELEAEKHLEENDSYRFFQPLGDLLITGPTLTNVMDLRLVLVG